MGLDLRYLEGKKFCVVLAKLVDENSPDGELTIKCIHGRANISHRGQLTVEHAQGSFAVPSSSHTRIAENDGTEMLGDAEYFVICRVSGMEL